MSSNPVPSSCENKSDVNFEDLWRQLGECHQHAIQELETKVAKLKKERCLDAQRLEVFYNRNQQLKEQNKTLQDTISSLEERLRDGECERCAILEDNLKNNQEQNTHLINKLEQEKKNLDDDRKKLNAELETLRRVCTNLQRSSSPEPGDCFIPDSPVMASSLPAANKLKKRKNIEKSKFVRYAERSLLAAHTSLFTDQKDLDAKENPIKEEVLVLNTCELDASQAGEELNSEEVIAETCRLDLLPLCMKNEKQHTLETFRSSKVLTKSYTLMNPSPDSTTDRSPSLLPRTKRFPNDSLNSNMAKRKKEESQLEYTEREVERKLSQSKQEQSILLKERSFEVGNKTVSNQDETLIEGPHGSSLSPVFKKPKAAERRLTQREGKTRPPLEDPSKSLCQTNVDNSPREFKVEPMWSMDPALALEMYESERNYEEKEENCPPGESIDSDSTWISHSLLQGRAKNSEQETYISGLGDKVNDSLDKLFDTSACGEYKSYNTQHMEGNDQLSAWEDEEEEEDEEHCEDDAENSFNKRKPGLPAFPHVAVIRKRDERRKLKGTTCKECEIYYAHLPEEEKQKKLSNCSRHRFLYIPPCTPENFWEVGFPSTQTCIERGYIKEDKTPQMRSRRRQPFNALFSPKGKNRGSESAK